jgi:hypothetical protein
MEGTSCILGKTHYESETGRIEHAWQVAKGVPIFGSLGGRLTGDVRETVKTMYQRVRWEDQGKRLID